MKKKFSFCIKFLLAGFVLVTLLSGALLRFYPGEADGQSSDLPTPTSTALSDLPDADLTQSSSEAAEAVTPLPPVTPTTEAATADSSITPTQEPTPEPTPEPSPEPAEVFADLLFAGDLMCLAGQQYAAEISGGGHDYSGSFALIADTLKEYDLVAANLETILSASNPYTTKLNSLGANTPNCNAPADYLDFLQAAGFQALVTANNHCLDGGTLGIDETLEQLDLRGIAHTGTYRADHDSERYLMLDCGGIQVALLSFTELINLRDSLSTAECRQRINCYSEAAAKEQITAARAAGAEFVVVYIHWGSENTHEVRSYQRTHAAELADAGADLIIGSHPHCLQEVEFLTAADGREVPCFYSLGNAVSSMARDINNDTVFVSVSLRRNEEGIHLDTLSLLPCHVLPYYQGSSHVIVPVSYPVTGEKTAALLAEAAERIRAVLSLPEN